MKVYKLELLILDFDNVGDDIPNIIENQKYPNDCISPNVISTESREYEWKGDLDPLNQLATRDQTFKDLFSNP